jgi:hypothetical protein
MTRRRNDVIRLGFSTHRTLYVDQAPTVIAHPKTVEAGGGKELRRFPAKNFTQGRGVQRPGGRAHGVSLCTRHWLGWGRVAEEARRKLRLAPSGPPPPSATVLGPVWLPGGV